MIHTPKETVKNLRLFLLHLFSNLDRRHQETDPIVTINKILFAENRQKKKRSSKIISVDIQSTKTDYLPTRTITWNACAKSNCATSILIFFMILFTLLIFEKHFKTPSKVASSIGSLDLRVRTEGCNSKIKWILNLSLEGRVSFPTSNLLPSGIYRSLFSKIFFACINGSPFFTILFFEWHYSFLVTLLLD